MARTRPHTTIGLKKTTKDKLDGNRAPGQCYDGFLCQMMDIWERYQSGNSLYEPTRTLRKTSLGK